MERERFPSEAQRIGNARQAVRNGERAKFEEFAKRTGREYKQMSRGFRGGDYGKR